MPYRHYGNIGDIWKHLSLCEILARESPRVYIEANTAGALYTLDRTPRQCYGVYHTYASAHRSPEVDRSVYLRALRDLNAHAAEPCVYAGSPALALRLLRERASRFVFYDIETEPLDAVARDALSLGLAGRVELRCEDSIPAVHRLLDHLAADAFIHIDPYVLAEPGSEGLSYLDVFLKAAERGVLALAWYGYFTRAEQAALMEEIRAKAQLLRPAHQFHAVEVELALIQQDRIGVNPGVLGCGVLTCNLAASTRACLADLAAGLCQIYADACFEGQSASLRWSLPLEVR